MDNVFLALDGNNGGDRIDMHIAGGRTWRLGDGNLSVEDTLLNLKVGHCCVYTINAVVPIEFVTGILSKVVTEQGGIEQAIRWIGWDEKFTQKLIDQVQEL